jgi:hypothetical protein
MIAGTFGVSRTVGDLERDAATGVTLGGTGAPDVEIDESKRFASVRYAAILTQAHAHRK